jgi:hypothetical protein
MHVKCVFFCSMRYEDTDVEVLVVGLAAEMAKELTSDEPAFHAKALVVPSDTTKRGRTIWMVTGAKDLINLKVLSLEHTLYVAHLFCPCQAASSKQERLCNDYMSAMFENKVTVKGYYKSNPAQPFSVVNRQVHLSTFTNLFSFMVVFMTLCRKNIRRKTCSRWMLTWMIWLWMSG